MTSMDFLNKVHKILDSQEYNLSYFSGQVQELYAVLQWQLHWWPVR